MGVVPQVTEALLILFCISFLYAFFKIIATVIVSSSILFASAVFHLRISPALGWELPSWGAGVELGAGRGLRGGAGVGGAVVAGAWHGCGGAVD